MDIEIRKRSLLYNINVIRNRGSQSLWNLHKKRGRIQRSIVNNVFDRKPYDFVCPKTVVSESPKFYIEH